MTYLADPTKDVRHQILDAVDHVVRSLPPVFSEKINPTVRVDGTSVDGVALAAVSTPYRQATVTAAKKVTDVDKAPIANVGTVWIGGSATDISGAVPLEPGQSMSLFDNGDLADYFLIVESANDGVSIVISA